MVMIPDSVNSTVRMMWRRGCTGSNKNMEEETVVVRIIALVSLVYLPATFVSTLFSTDIVKHQDDSYPVGKFAQLAMTC